MMQYHCKGMKLEKALRENECEGLMRVAERCVGYNGADIAALCREAGLSAAASAGKEKRTPFAITRVTLKTQ